MLERLPPQNLEAEMAVLGAMLLGDRASIERAAEILQREDFYRDAHGSIFEAMLHLAESDEPVDPITLKDELSRRQMLDPVGGIPYIIQLAEFVPTTANLPYYAKIVSEKATLRRLIGASSQIAGMAYAGESDVEDMVDQAEKVIFDVARRRSKQAFTPLRPLLNEVFDRIDTLYHEKGVVTGVDTGFNDLNYITSGLQGGDLIILAARPSMGKTSLAMGIAQNAALRAGKSVAVFSLEMSKESLVQRMICSEARVDAHRLRTGYLQEEDWTRLADAVQRLWDCNLFIDDSTEMSSLEMRAKCRRLRAEQGVDMIIVDYLQLMRGNTRNVENRNQEISEIARGLKSLARELNAPVIALSQLSRNVERREDKRPMLSDLRECLVGSTRLWCAKTGKLIPLSQIQPGDSILTMNNQQKIRASSVTHLWKKGVKPVFRVTTENGRVISCTSNHPFLTQRGYVALGEIKDTDYIASAWKMPAIGQSSPEREDLCRFLGYMVGDGHFGKHRTLSFISADRATYDDIKQIVGQYFPSISFTEEESCYKKTCWEVDFVCHHKGNYGKPGGNPLINWLRDDIGILGQICHTKRVPSYVYESGNLGISAFLAGYLATDGCVKYRGNKWAIHYDTVSFALAQDVQLLLQRLGIVASLQAPHQKNNHVRPIWRINLNPLDSNLRAFATQMEGIIRGVKGELLQQFLNTTPHKNTNPGVFRLPESVSTLLAQKTAHLRQQGKKLPEGQIGRQYWKPQRKSLGRKSLGRDICENWAQKMQDGELSLWANSEVLWEKIRHIESCGEEETYDICVPETGCFLAEGIVVHNSGAIEAEADIVSFIYRPSYYERKQAVSEEEGNKEEGNRPAGEYESEEAEIIIAKQRNGPVGTVKLAFIPKFARFDNLAEYSSEF